MNFLYTVVRFKITDNNSSLEIIDVFHEPIEGILTGTTAPTYKGPGNNIHEDLPHIP